MVKYLPADLARTLALQDAPFFSSFLFCSRCWYLTYILLMISSLALPTFSFVHLPPNTYALTLAMTFFKHSRFLSRPLVYQQYLQKSYHRLICFQYHPFPLLHVEISVI